MNTTTTQSWAEANQRYLVAALACVRAELAHHAARLRGEEHVDHTIEARAALQSAEAAMPAPSALDRLCAAMGLSLFERDVLVLCAGIELDADVAELCRLAAGDDRRAFPTFSLALAALPGAHWSALSPASPLRKWRLVDVVPGDSLVAARLRIDEHVLHFLAGVNAIDERLEPLVHRMEGHDAHVPTSYEALAERMAAMWTKVDAARDLPVIQLCAADGEGARMIAGAASAAIGMRVYVLRSHDIPASPAERDALARLWEREAILSGCVLLIDADDADTAECARTVVPFAESIAGVVLLIRREPLRTQQRALVRMDVPTTTAAEQRDVWSAVLGDAVAGLNGHVDRVISQFRLGPRGVQAARSALAAGTSLWDACRLQTRARMDDLAQRIVPAVSWDDLVLPEAQRAVLRDIAAHVRRRHVVYDRWGFAGKGTRGLGISALFTGASGTGKTMAAEVLANELELDLYRIDLSSVVSKYIGETEKNLRKVFDAAEEGGAILFFDEADALFGKRSDVKDSHDRYANIEVSYLLQRMEEYRGLAVLTTNLKDAIDTAFLRRLRFVVQFPFPDATQRAEIWRRIFPYDTPTEGLDPQKLSRLNVAGGNIRNVALNAAFLAADAGEPVRMMHVLRAARSEYQKLEKQISETEIAGWV